MRRPAPARRLPTLLLLALALPLAACGDDGDEETAATVTAPAATTAAAEATTAAATTAAATTAEATTAEAAEGALADVLLTAADLPAGFEETPYESDAK